MSALFGHGSRQHRRVGVHAILLEHHMIALQHGESDCRVLAGPEVYLPPDSRTWCASQVGNASQQRRIQCHR